MVGGARCGWGTNTAVEIEREGSGGGEGTRWMLIPTCDFSGEGKEERRKSRSVGAITLG